MKTRQGMPQRQDQCGVPGAIHLLHAFAIPSGVLDPPGAPQQKTHPETVNPHQGRIKTHTLVLVAPDEGVFHLLLDVFWLLHADHAFNLLF